MTHYKGFTIDPQFNIYHNGKKVFTAFYQRCLTMLEAQNMIDNSLAAKERFAKMPDKQQALVLMNNESNRDRQERQVNNYFENQLNDMENGNY